VRYDVYIYVVRRLRVKIIPLWGPEGSGEVKASRFRDRLSALRTGRLYPQEYHGTHFNSPSRPRAHGIVLKNPQ
jgi:hypothetical protein